MSDQIKQLVGSGLSDGALLTGILSIVFSTTEPQKLAALRKLPLVVIEEHLAEAAKAARPSKALKVIKLCDLREHYVNEFIRRWPEELPPTSLPKMTVIFRLLLREFRSTKVQEMVSDFIRVATHPRDCALSRLYSRRAVLAQKRT